MSRKSKRTRLKFPCAPVYEVPAGSHLHSYTPLEKKNARCQRYAYCVCPCGQEFEALLYNVNSGHTTSCGCQNHRHKKHGMSQAREHHTWTGMKSRCMNPKNPSYANYGGRGIGVCENWRNSFEAFFKDMGPCPEGHSIDRINVNGNYEPANCRWATSKVQANNTTVNHRLTHNGESKTIAEWGDATGLGRNTIRLRIKYGWSIEEALTTPHRGWPEKGAA
jgi:hypothetical protein